MWPERNEGIARPRMGRAPTAHNPNRARRGFYVLHADYPDLAAALTIPGAAARHPRALSGAAPGPSRRAPPPHRSLRATMKASFRYSWPPASAPATATNAALGATLAQLNAAIPALYQAHAEA